MKFSLENLFDFKQLLRHLSTGLERLDLDNNFEGFREELVIPAGSELRVRNQLNFIPSTYIIGYQEGNGLITASGTPWDINFLYLRNHGAEEVTATIRFLR